MRIRPRNLWLVFVHLLIVLLAVLLVLALYLAFNPGPLGALIAFLPLPGMVHLPQIGPTPIPPFIDVPKRDAPGGYVAFSGKAMGESISCAFLLRLDDSHLVGVSAAHASPRVPSGIHTEFFSPGGARMAVLDQQVEHGSVFQEEHFTTDTALWEAAEVIDRPGILQADPRGTGQPGEKVLVYGVFENGAGGSRSWPGVVMSVKPEAIFIQLEDSFYPGGFSGCPVVSQYTGRVIGMAVAGHNMPPVVMGLNPIGAIVEKAENALAGQ